MYIKEALGTNGNGITLGPPTSVDPTNLGVFVKELEIEQGPFIFFTVNQIQQSGLPISEKDPILVDIKMFMKWFTAYEPEGIAYISKIMMLQGMPVDKPKWVAEGKVRFKKATYELYKASMIRVRDVSVSQGLVTANPMDHTHFMSWWRKHDQAGWAAALVLSSTNKVPYDVPAKLFEFYKADGGVPSAELLGKLTIWGLARKNWLWVGLGAAGGAAIYKLRQRRRLEKADTMMENCGCCGCE